MTRCFVLGNGPSLNKTPLHLLENEYSWGVNQVHMIYPHTTWRPTHVTFAEMTAGGPDWFPKIWAAVKANQQAKRFARDDAWWWTDEMEAIRPKVIRFNACTHHDILDERPIEERYKKIPTEFHFPQICKFGGSVPMTIQLAIQEGFDEVYLLGCDLGHKAGTSNHFHPDYALTRGITAEKAIKRNEANTMGHQFIYNNSPIPIYNATIGGELEVYPRVDFDSLF